jgi:hypothetical protein
MNLDQDKCQWGSCEQSSLLHTNQDISKVTVSFSRRSCSMEVIINLIIFCVLSWYFVIQFLGMAGKIKEYHKNCA